MFKITVDLRRVGFGSDYEVHSFKSASNDIQKHMLQIFALGWDVLNIRSEPYLGHDDPLRSDQEFMTFINSRGEHVTDSDTDESSGSN